MAPSSSPPPEGALGPRDREHLLDLADLAILRGLEGAGPPVVDCADLPASLRRSCGVFVTVTVAGVLNGCIGTVAPTEPLAAAVPRLAWEAAFDDPRLPALRRQDYPRVGIEISLLSPPVPMDVGSEAELVARLRPGIDGVILGAGARRATFLPAVWDKLPDPSDFVTHLKAKAGIPAAGWPPGISVARYSAEEFGRHGLLQPGDDRSI